MDITLLVTGSLLVIAITYLVVRFATNKPVEMILDKGGKNEEGVIYPDFERVDIKELFIQCKSESIPKDIAIEFLVAMYNSLNFISEPEAPELDDNRYEKWDLDDDVEDPINYILLKHDMTPIKWNQREVLELDTIRDILLFISSKLDLKANKSLKSGTPQSGAP